MSIVGAKIGTKSWSDAPQNEITKADGKHSNSASDLQRLGEESTGDIANKIADPNYVDPSKKIRSVGSDKMDKDAFMKLMLAQLKNQDPTNPLKSHEMAAQLAQFSSVEQLQNINTTLDSLQKGQKPAESYQALNFIGKSVAGDSAKIIRLKGDKDHEYNYTLGDAAKDAEIKVKNSSGEVVRTAKLHDLKQGDNKWVWNGKVENGTAAPVGEYNVSIEAKNAAGKKLFVKTDFAGIISGVSYTADGPVLMVGSQTVKLKDVKKIVDPGMLTQGQKPGIQAPTTDQKTAANPAPDLKLVQAASENEEKGAEEAPPSAGELLTSVGMSNGMMEKFKKDLSPESTAEARAEAMGTAKIIPESKPEAKAESTSKGLPNGGRMPGTKAPVPNVNM